MIVVDTETTGMSAEKHSIISIGAVDFLNPVYCFYGECRIRDGAEILEEALKINGFSRGSLFDTRKLTLQQLMNSFISWSSEINDRTLAGENPNFDRDFLNFSAKIYGLPLFGRRTVDLHSLSYIHLLLSGVEIPLSENSSKLNLDKTLESVLLPAEPKPHNALTGAKLEAEAFSRLLYGNSLFEEYKKFPIPEHLKK